MPTYRKASAEVNQIVEEMLEKYHGPLRESGIKIECLFAYALTDDNGDSTGPALKLGGYACNAIVRVLNLKDRTVGRGDAEICIDGDQWDTWSDEQKAALIDHEIEHLELKVDGDNNVVRDDLDRPKLRLKKHDHQFGWFDSIARRHGAASFEVQQFRQHIVKKMQAWLPGFDLSETEAPEVYDPEAEDGDAEVPATSGRNLNVSITVGDKTVETNSRELEKLASSLEVRANRKAKSKPITARDGRKMDVDEMIDDIDRSFKRGRKAAAASR